MVLPTFDLRRQTLDRFKRVNLCMVKLQRKVMKPDDRRKEVDVLLFPYKYFVTGLRNEKCQKLQCDVEITYLCIPLSCINNKMAPDGTYENLSKSAR